GLLNRAMFWDVWRRNAHGYLYYLSTWWGRKATPWERPNFMLPQFTYKYRHGDGYFFYPPLRKGETEQPILDHVVPTIRWELMREGAEDYDYLRMRDQLVAATEARKLPAAAKGREILSEARQLADAIAGSGSNYPISALKMPPTPGWSWSTQEGWLHHRGGQASTLKVTLDAVLKDGAYDLSLRVYDDKDYRGRPYSRFTVNGNRYASPGTDAKGPVNVEAGQVEVRGGVCAFELGSLAEESGVIVYGVGLRSAAKAKSRDLYSVRRDVADAIETLQAALGGQ
ncbi:MAG: DUF4091 domain-containing protein, partial [Planctomycetes bacterium]|nr:DUF4091 domain-containing protein [Planctomycetota bacterium]